MHKVIIKTQLEGLGVNKVGFVENRAPNARGLYKVKLEQEGGVYIIPKGDLKFIDEENLFAGKGTVRMQSGTYINVFDPFSGDIDINDIAHVLSMNCRFAGNLPYFYSVAQHCCIAYDIARSIEDKRAALLHDASEAYILDIPSPIKKELDEYKRMEDRLMNTIGQKYEFQYPLNEVIKEIDFFLLEQEWDQLLLKKNMMIDINHDNYQRIYTLWSQQEAKRQFLLRFKSVEVL